MRYFFNLAGTLRDLDDEGHDFASLADARTQAVRFAGEVLRDQPELLDAGADFRIELQDEAGRLVFTFAASGTDGPGADDGS